MNLFLNDAESPFARCFIKVGHDVGHSIIAARQQVSDEPKSLIPTDRPQGVPQILTWNLSSIFSIRLVLRQCNFLWDNEQPITYVLLLQSSMISASLFRDDLHEVQQKIEEQFYSQLFLLRELESRRAKLRENLQNNSRIAFVLLEENNPVELLGGSIYSALRHSFHHVLSNSNDPNIWGFYSQSNNYELYSKFILYHLENHSDKNTGKWLHFKKSWNLKNISNHFINRW